MADVITLSSPTPNETAGLMLAEWLTTLHRAKGSVRLGIPGGSAVAALDVARRIISDDVWRSVLLTWVDERVVPVASDESNRGLAQRRGLLSVAPKFVLPLVEDGETGHAAAIRFASEFMSTFNGALDIALLGLGEDGHIASLFPSHLALHAGSAVAFIDDSPKPPRERVTFTLPVLSNTTTLRLVVATGAGKRAALERLWAGDSAIPATRLGALTVVTDQTKGTP